MKEIEAVYKMKKPGKFMSMVMTTLTGEECTPTTLGDFEQQYPNEFKQMKKLLDIDFPREVRNYNNTFGVTGNPIDEFAKYVWTRVSENKEDFDLMFDKGLNGIEIKRNTLLAIQVATYQVIDLKETSQDNGIKNAAKALYTSFANCSISFTDFAEKAHALNERENKNNNKNLVPSANSQMQDADQSYRQTSSNEVGWEKLKKDCLYDRKYGFTVYEINDQEDLAAVADGEGWCVAHKGNSGKTMFYDCYHGGPYFLICLGDEKPYILMHPKSHQFKTPHNSSPFSGQNKADRPSRAKIFEYAKQILEDTKGRSGWDGQYSGDFVKLQNPEELEVLDYDFTQIIANANCPKDTLEKAVQSTDENIIINVVKNEKIPYDNLVKLAESVNPTTQIDILNTIAMSSQLDDNLANLLLKKNRYTSINIAKNDKCSVAIMKKIITGKYDPSGTAMIAFLGKPYCTEKILEKYIENNKFYQNEEMYRSLLTNPKLTPKMIQTVMDKVEKMPEGSTKINIQALCYKHPNLPVSYLKESISKVDRLKKEYEEIHKNEEHPTPFNLSGEEEKNLEMVLRNPKCSPDMLAQVTNMFFKQADQARILVAVAENPSTPERSLLKIAERVRKNIDLAVALVNNRNCPFNALMASAKVLDEAQDKKKDRSALLNAIMKNQYCTDKLKEEVLYRKTFENIRDTIFPEELLYPLVIDEDMDIAHVARQQLLKVHHKTVDENGNIIDENGNIVYRNKASNALPAQDATSEKTSSKRNKYNRIVASVIESEIALRITREFC